MGRLVEGCREVDVVVANLYFDLLSTWGCYSWFAVAAFASAISRTAWVASTVMGDVAGAVPPPSFSPTAVLSQLPRGHGILRPHKNKTDIAESGKVWTLSPATPVYKWKYTQVYRCHACYAKCAEAASLFRLVPFGFGPRC